MWFKTFVSAAFVSAVCLLGVSAQALEVLPESSVTTRSALLQPLDVRIVLPSGFNEDVMVQAAPPRRQPDSSVDEWYINRYLEWQTATAPDGSTVLTITSAMGFREPLIELMISERNSAASRQAVVLIAPQFPGRGQTAPVRHAGLNRSGAQPASNSAAATGTSRTNVADSGMTASTKRHVDHGMVASSGKKHDHGMSASKSKAGDHGMKASKGKATDHGMVASSGKKHDHGMSASKSKAGDHGMKASKGKATDHGMVASSGKKHDHGMSASKSKDSDHGMKASKGKAADHGMVASSGKKHDHGMSASKSKAGDHGMKASKGKAADHGMVASSGKKHDHGMSASKPKTADHGMSASEKTGIN